LGERILLKGISSSLAQLHSTTATPDSLTISLSAGETGIVPFGLAMCEDWPFERGATYDSTTPLNLEEPTFMSFINPMRASFFPEHLRGSQWLKSHIACAALASDCPKR
jgi:hypothetical protein